ncbi:MAG: aminotransferase class I/II-fold pyridoxal phosphate-dependent enzyme, partial [Opitutales bacterium]
INESGEFIYSTYLPPSSAAAAKQSIELVQSAEDIRAGAQEQARAFRRSLRASDWEVIGEDSPIVPIICGSSSACLALAETLLASGVKVGAIRPPTVPEGAARLRLSLKSSLTEADYARLLNTFGRKHTNRD